MADGSVGPLTKAALYAGGASVATGSSGAGGAIRLRTGIIGINIEAIKKASDDSYIDYLKRVAEAARKVAQEAAWAARDGGRTSFFSKVAEAQRIAAQTPWEKSDGGRTNFFTQVAEAQRKAEEAKREAAQRAAEEAQAAWQKAYGSYVAALTQAAERQREIERQAAEARRKAAAREEFVTVAEQQEGTTEGSSANTYLKAVYSSNSIRDKAISTSSTLWCAIFVSWVANETGATPHRNDNVENWFHTAEGNLKSLSLVEGDVPQRGDLVVIDWVDDDPEFHHIGIVTWYSSDASFGTVEGNTSNPYDKGDEVDGVYKKTRGVGDGDVAGVRFIRIDF